MKDNLSILKIATVKKYPFYGYLLLSTDITFDKHVQTAQTDGISIKINPTWFHKLSKNDKIFVLAHEVSHCAMLHPHRRKGRSIDRWNIACDVVVNENIIASRVSNFSKQSEIITQKTLQTKFNIAPVKTDDLVAEQIYAKLPKDVSSVQRNAIGRDISENPTKEKRQHEYWKNVVFSAKQYQRKVGSLPAWAQRQFNVVETKINWRAMMQIFYNSTIKSKRSMARPNRRHIWRMSILPGRYQRKIYRLVICVDTSGSISESELSQFISESLSIASYENTEVTLITFDTEIKNEIQLQSTSDTQNITIQGGGGTSFKDIIAYAIKNQPDGLIILTDGFGVYPPETFSPTLWILTENHKKPKFGWSVSM